MGEINFNNRFYLVQYSWIISTFNQYEIITKEMFCILFFFLIDREKGRRGRGSRRERLPSRLHGQCPEIMTWGQIKSPMLNRLSHPGAPHSFSYIKSSKSNMHFILIADHSLYQPHVKRSLAMCGDIAQCSSSLYCGLTSVLVLC